MNAAGGTMGAWRRLWRAGAGLGAFCAAVWSIAPAVAQTPDAAAADPGQAPVTGPVRGAPTTGFGSPETNPAVQPPIGTPGGAPPATGGFGALGAQQAPGTTAPLFPVRGFGDDPALDNPAAGFGAGLMGAAGAALGRLYVTAGLDSLFDSNIRRVGRGQPLRFGDSLADLRLTPQLEVGANVPLGRQRVFGLVSFGRDFFVENGRFNRNRFRAAGGVNLALGQRCSGQGDIDYAERQSLLSEISELVPNVQQSISYGFQGQCRTATGLSLGGQVRRVQTRNDNPSRTPFDNNSLIYGPTLSYGRPTLGTFSLSATWTDADYPNRLVLVPSGALVRDGISIFQARAGYARNLGPRLALAGGVSVFRNSAEPRAVVELVPPNLAVLVNRGSATTIGFDVSANYNSGGRLTVQAVASRSNQVSVNVGALSRTRQEYGVDVGYRLGQRITLGLNTNYLITDFANSISTPDELLLRNRDRLFRVVGSIDYAPRPLYAVGLEVAHQRRDSDPSVYSFASTSVRLRLRLNYGRTR